MPLTQGCSKEAAKENYSKLLEEDYSPDEAYAITFRIARQNMNKCSSERQEEIMNDNLMG